MQLGQGQEERDGACRGWDRLAGGAGCRAGAAGGGAALAEAVDVWPEISPLVRVLLAAVIFGFGASGVYSQAAGLRSGERAAPEGE